MQMHVEDCHNKYIMIYHHYTNLTFVHDVRDDRESGRSREAIRPELKRCLSLHQWTWSRHEVASPLTQLAMY